MLFKTFSAAVFGIDAYLVEVEVDVVPGFEGHFTVVGLPDIAVKESRERIRAALRNCGFDFPSGHVVTINLAPADTLLEQWTLHQAFASLPWPALGRKEKLEEYKSIVSQARSHAFHHGLPFDSTVEIDLSTSDVRAEKIRLFVPFGQKEGRGVHLKDQKLAEVLAEFSRAKERPVSQIFWKANLAVMHAACQLAEEVLSALVLIHNARRECA